jgi:hypothetical protein
VQLDPREKPMNVASLDRPGRITQSGQLEAGRPTRRTTVWIGILFLVQMVTAMVGSSMVESLVPGAGGSARLTAGALFGIASGLTVAGIGFLMYPVLKLANRRLAPWYPAFRLIELAVSAAGGIYLLTQLKVFPNHMLLIYLPTGNGGLLLGYMLFVSRLVPRPIALLCLVGYALLFVGAFADLGGLVDMNHGSGMVLLAPGGLFEFVALPVWLFARGFNLSESGIAPAKGDVR